MRIVLQDLRYGTRALIKNPAFTLVAVTTLAIGIGANSAIFSVVNTVLLQPFSFEQPERLVVLWERSLNQGLPRMVVSPPNYADLRNQNHVFDDVAAYRPQDFNLMIEGVPERAEGLLVSSTMFSMLGLKPLVGRDFQPDEDQPGKPPTVILSYGFWQRHFGGNSGVVGQNILLGVENATVIGVMPPDFEFPPPIAFRGEARSTSVDLWTPLRYALEQDQRGAHNLFVLARLKPGVTAAQAEADLRNITQRLAKDFPQTNSGWDAYVVPLHEQVVGDVKTALWVLPVTVGLVLLIACANVANLLMVRGAGRQREMAIRASLGASKSRLMWQMLIESALLSSVGALAGLVLASWALKVISALAPANIYRLDSVKINGPVILFTATVSLLTTLVFGILPVWQASRLNLVTALKEGSAAVSGSSGLTTLRNSLVVLEVALALVLMAGAGLVIRSFAQLLNAPTGVKPEHLVAMRLALPKTSYPDRQARLTFINNLAPKLASLPGTSSAAFGSNLPLDVGLQGTEFKIEGRDVVAGHEPHTQVSIVSPRYFQTLGIPILMGRDFETFDRADAPGVVIINGDLARAYFPNQNPIGRRLEMGFRDGVSLEIIGVTADVKQTSLQADPYPGMFLPYSQVPTAVSLVFVFRSANEPNTVAAAARAAVREVDGRLPVYDVKTMNQVLSTAAARPRFLTFLLTGFSGIAVLLAAIGLYGVMSYTVAQGTREIGIRVALGARAHDVMKLIVGRGLLLTLLGAGLGLIAASGLTRLISSLLFKVQPHDPLTFAGVAFLLILVALLACYIPARRATKVDPLVALRYE